MEKTIAHFRKLLLFSGLFNIVMASPLIFPSVVAWYFKLLWSVNNIFSLGGTMPIPPEDGVSLLLINTAGIDLVLIGSIVIYASLDPVNRIGIPLLNAVGRTLFAGIIVYYCISYDIMRLILVIGIIDVLISIGFVYYAVKLKSILPHRKEL